jgi:predicted dipeptidase
MKINSFTFSSKYPIVVILKIFLITACLCKTIGAANADEDELVRLKNISSNNVSIILERYGRQPFDSFNTFVFEVYQSSRSLFTNEQHSAIGKFIANRKVEPEERFIIHRLLGIYTRLKYGGEARRLLAKLVSIPTFRVEGVEQHENPNFKEMQSVIAATAKKFDLTYRNIDGRVYEVSLGRSSADRGELIGLHAHADVVPVNPEQWVLDDGTKLDPFKMTQTNDRWYGRGTQDDKNGIVAVLFAMRILKEERVKLFNEFKLLIDTTEETTSTAIPYYLERNPTPDYNIALDGDYPVVIAEKGFAVISTKFTVREASEEGLGEAISMTGGLAYNQIPANSETKIVTANPSLLVGKINELSSDFIAQAGGGFEVVAQVEKDYVILDIKGLSAHSSAPESGVNPVSRMLVLLDQLRRADLLKSNHITDAAAYAAQNWGLDYLGEKFGISYVHDFMGPMTAAFTKVGVSENELEVAVNLRLPKGKDLAQLRAEVESKLAQWRKSANVDFELSYRAKEPMYRDPSGEWLESMLDIASENLNLAKTFGSSSGGTSIHFLPNGVQFGLSMPNEKYTGHNANEFKSIDQFLLDLQIVTEMMSRLGQMKGLKK